jgi:hypothetical protein
VSAAEQATLNIAPPIPRTINTMLVAAPPGRDSVIVVVVVVDHDDWCWLYCCISSNKLIVIQLQTSPSQHQQ